jgi:cytidine deaminase
MLEPHEQRLADATSRLVRSLPASDGHTVMAAAMDVDGEIHTGVNIFHVAGGPCAELVAVGAAAAAGAAPLMTIVAVGDSDRGVIAPCSRCRQVLLDLHPDIYVILPAKEGLTSVPVRDLLPSGYCRPDPTGRPRIVYFHGRHYDSIISGRKTATVRYRDPLAVGPAAFVFADGQSVRHLDGEVKAVCARTVATLSDDDAHREDFEDRASFLSALAQHYPDLVEADVVDVVTFRLATP